MSKKWIYILVSLGLLQSCADRAYRGDADMQMAINEPMPVMIVVGDPQNLLSKGSGAIDSDTDSWGGAPIYVYSFRKDLYTAFSSLGSDQNGECLVDASVEDPGNLAGKPARVSELDAYATWTGPVKTIYYPANIQPYDFYAYYIDDMQIPSESISRTQTSISFPVEIDGSQDLMSAKAALTDSQLNREDLSDEDRYDMINYAYSAFTAAMNIQPVVYFKHHLVRLCFDVYPYFTEESGKQLFVDAIEVRSRTKGTFTVADKSEERIGVDFSSDDADPSALPLLSLKGDGGEDLIPADNPDIYNIPPYTGDPEATLVQRTPVRIGESLLVAPDTQYEVHLHLREISRNGTVYLSDNKYVITPSSGAESFSPGNQYTVRFSVYGLTEVQINVGLVPWGDGGSLTVDEDVPPAG